MFPIRHSCYNFSLPQQSQVMFERSLSVFCVSYLRWICMIFKISWIIFRFLCPVFVDQCNIPKNFPKTNSGGSGHKKLVSFFRHRISLSCALSCARSGTGSSYGLGHSVVFACRAQDPDIQTDGCVSTYTSCSWKSLAL